jgi:hypothetical protein
MQLQLIGRRSLRHRRSFSTMTSKPGYTHADSAAVGVACTLCHSCDTSIFSHHPRTKATPARVSHRCGVCALVFIPSAYHLTAGDEKRRYDAHMNRSTDEGYRASLLRLMTPLAQLLHAQQKSSSMSPPVSSNLHGLDYGCGPTPLLAAMMHELHGFPMQSYDPIYHPDT